ncbi:MAG: glycosyltransferase family 4 protein [Synechococcaceae cyanobacterium RL_1_2]|nr:glycosyltransferase family 4 protein [Synechococcaceae cyanobacterium RL_1_2]
MIEEFVVKKSPYQLSGLVSVSKKLHSFLTNKLNNTNNFANHTLIERIPYGINLSEKIAKYPEDVLRLIFVGRLEEEQKRISDVVLAFCDVATNISGVEITILGDGSAKPKVELILKNNPNLPIKLVGFVDNNKVKEYLLNSHIIVLLSDYEGLPISLLEGMACGLVPVCLNNTCSGITELVKHNETGLLVNNRKEDFVAAIKKLKSNLKLWQKLSKNAHEKIKNEYSTEKMSNLWIDFLTKLNQKYLIKKPIQKTDSIKFTPGKF